MQSSCNGEYAASFGKVKYAASFGKVEYAARFGKVKYAALSFGKVMQQALGK